MSELGRYGALLTTALLLAGCGPSPWEEARNADTIEALTAFAEQHPDSEHVDNAIARIEALWQARWEEAAAADTRSGYVEFVRSGASGAMLAAARAASMALQEQPAAAAGRIEMYGMYGPSGLIEDVDTVTTRYSGIVAGKPATVQYSITAGSDADGEQQFFSFDWSERSLTFGAPAAVEGYVELEIESDETVRYELFGMVPGPDGRASGSYLVGRGPDVLWSRVEGMRLAPSAESEAPRVLAADEAVLFALNEHLGLEYVP